MLAEVGAEAWLSDLKKQKCEVFKPRIFILIQLRAISLELCPSSAVPRPSVVGGVIISSTKATEH